MEQSHAEMQFEHYQAFKNPQYRLDGMFDVLREEIMMAMPTNQFYIQRTEPIQTEPREFSSLEWEELQQIKGRLIHLENMLFEIIQALGLERDDEGNLYKKIRRDKL